MSGSRVALVLSLLLSAPGCVGGDKDDPNDHCGELTTDAAWTNELGAHIVSCDLVLDGATLSIDPGVEVLFANDASLSVGCDGASVATLTVTGTEEDPVRFASETGISGAWNYLRLCAGAESSSLSWLTIGGAGAYDNFHPRVGLIVDTAEVGVDHVTISDTNGLGFSLRSGGRFTADSTTLIASGNSESAGTADANSLDSVPTDGTYSGNTYDFIQLDSERFTVSATWEDLGVPIVAAGGLTLEGEPGSPASLTLGPGLTLDMGGGRAVTVGSANHPAELAVAGSAEAPVVFTNTTAPARAAWEGIVLSAASVGASFDFMTLGYARRGLSMNAVNPTVDHTTLHDNTCGIYLLAGAAPTLGDITYTNNETDICE